MSATDEKDDYSGMGDDRDLKTAGKSKQSVVTDLGQTSSQLSERDITRDQFIFAFNSFADKDGCVSWAQFQTISTNVDKDAFDQCDTDRDGRISLDDLNRRGVTPWR